MHIADVFTSELERSIAEGVVSEGLKHLGPLLVEQLLTAQQTLTGISAMYVKTFNELEDLKKGKANGLDGMPKNYRPGDGLDGWTPPTFPLYRPTEY